MAVPASAIRTARAWLLDVGAGIRVAAGAHQVTEYLLSPEAICLPLTPAHCRAVVIWRERMIPLVDLSPLLPRRAAPDAGRHLTVILAYQLAPGEPLRYGALRVHAAPVETLVTDDMACPLPEDSTVWPHLAASCFSLDDKAVPVLDGGRLFGRPLRFDAPLSERAAEPAIEDVESARAAPSLAAGQGPKAAADVEIRQAPDAAPGQPTALPEPSEHDEGVALVAQGERWAIGTPEPADVRAEQAREALDSGVPGIDAFDGVATEGESAAQAVAAEPLCTGPAAEADPAALLERGATGQQAFVAAEEHPVEATADRKQPLAAANARRVASTLRESIERHRALARQQALARRKRTRVWAGWATATALVLATLLIVFLDRQQQSRSAAGRIEAAREPTARATREADPDKMGKIAAPAAPVPPPH